jgi:hypothetical protein
VWWSDWIPYTDVEFESQIHLYILWIKYNTKNIYNWYTKWDIIGVISFCPHNSNTSKPNELQKRPPGTGTASWMSELNKIIWEAVSIRRRKVNPHPNYDPKCTKGATRDKQMLGTLSTPTTRHEKGKIWRKNVVGHQVSLRWQPIT